MTPPSLSGAVVVAILLGPAMGLIFGGAAAGLAPGGLTNRQKLAIGVAVFVLWSLATFAAVAVYHHAAWEDYRRGVTP